jgi:phage/plasmid-like protein (TIGR03299 family)
MSHGILQNDFMFSANGVRPWHGLGAVVDGAPTSEDAIRIAKLDWLVEKVPLYARGDLVPGYFATMRSGSSDFLGIVGSQYKIIQNVDAFAFVDEIMGQPGNPCVYETAGSLFGNRRVFLLVKLPERKVLGDSYVDYLAVVNSHDGSLALSVFFTSVRVVCNNTCQLALRTTPRSLRIRHMANADLRKAEAFGALASSSAYFRAMESFASEVVGKKVNAEQLLLKLFPETDGMSRRQMDSLDEVRGNVLSLFKGKDDLQNFRGSGWGFYNAVADFVSNAPPRRRTVSFAEKKMSGFMEGYPLLLKAQELIQAA